MKAEGLLAFNKPGHDGRRVLLHYFRLLVRRSVHCGGSMTTGDLTSLFSYIMSLLMSLMMLSMVVVMICMSLASIRRIKRGAE